MSEVLIIVNSNYINSNHILSFEKYRFSSLQLPAACYLLPALLPALLRLVANYDYC